MGEMGPSRLYDLYWWMVLGKKLGLVGRELVGTRVWPMVVDGKDKGMM